METFTGNGKLIRAIRELQAVVFKGGPRSTPGALVSRTTRGDIVQPTARPARKGPANGSIPTWR